MAGQTNTVVIFGNMRRQGILVLAISMLGLCIAAGCVRGVGTRPHDGTAATSPNACAGTPNTPGPDNPPASQPAQIAASSLPNTVSPPAAAPTTMRDGVVLASADTSQAATAVRFAVVPDQAAGAQLGQPEVVPLPQPTASENKTGVAESVASSSGEPRITLHVDNLDVSKTLEMVSRQARANILVSPGVTGTVTLDLRNKTVDETLQTLARLCRLTIRRDKDIIYISTPGELRQIEEDDLPIRVYHLNYVKSMDVQAMIQPLLSSKGKLSKSPDAEIGVQSDASGGGGAGGTSSVKAGGNSMAGGDILVVQDYEQVLKSIDRVVAQIDVQPIQVLIEAVIVSIKLNKDMDLGVNFALLDGAGTALGVVGNGAAINAAAGFTPASVLATGGKLASGFAENVPGVKFGWVGDHTTGFIRALEHMGETKVLACPRILVLNKQPAQLHLGKQLGYQTSTVSQTSTTQTVQFLSVGTLLLLRPYVSSDGMVRMEVHPERSTGQLDSNGVPQTDTTTVTSNVLVPDGATIVIGGLMDTQVDKDWQGVPFLSRIPVLGYAFRHTVEATVKTELIVILTPHIWRPQCLDAINHLGQPRALGLEERVGQRPHAEARDGPNLFDIPPSRQCPEPDPGPGQLAPIPLGAPVPTANQSAGVGQGVPSNQVAPLAGR
jgi:type IV pilus secretin PilQ/predicted competence protein